MNTTGTGLTGAGEFNRRTWRCRQFKLLQADTETGLHFQEGGVRVMTAQRTATITHPYDAYELKLLYKHHLSYGVSTGIGLILTFIVIVFTVTRLRPSDTIGSTVTIHGDDYHGGSIHPILIPKVRPENSSIVHKKGVPVPVPDPKANSGEILIDQNTLSQESDLVLEKFAFHFKLR